MTPSPSSPTERVADIEARLAKATPWTPADCGYRVEGDGYISVPECATLGETLIMLSHDYENDGRDWDFLAHSQQDMAYLLAALRESREQCERLQDDEREAVALRAVAEGQAFAAESKVCEMELRLAAEREANDRGAVLLAQKASSARTAQTRAERLEAHNKVLMRFQSAVRRAHNGPNSDVWLKVHEAIIIVVLIAAVVWQWLMAQQNKALKQLFEAYFAERNDERRHAENVAPPFNLFAFALAIAPRATLRTLGGALHDQGLQVETIITEPIARHEPTVPDYSGCIHGYVGICAICEAAHESSSPTSVTIGGPLVGTATAFNTEPSPSVVSHV